jgi:hypothetical protein
MTSMVSPASGAIVSDLDGALAAAARGRRGVVLRRVVVDLFADAAPVVAARLVELARVDALRLAEPAAFRVRVAARRVVVAARFRVAVARVRDPLAICRACFVRLSMRLSTVLTSARVLAFLACACNCLIAARAVLSASFSRLST